MKLQNAIYFNEFYSTICNQSMDIQLAYKLNNLLLSIANDLDFYKAELTKIFTDYIETDDNGNFKMSEDGRKYKIKEGMVAEFNERSNNLLNIDINDVADSNKLNISELGDIKLSPIDLVKIQDFLK